MTLTETVATPRAHREGEPLAQRDCCAAPLPPFGRVRRPWPRGPHRSAASRAVAASVRSSRYLTITGT